MAVDENRRRRYREAWDGEAPNNLVLKLDEVSYLF